ncbi:MAG: flavodoxin-dependent (E)-4-hydroxy-3-methylbut-2-enyl-diphosphate synthase [Acidobacteria bacterium]|nr:flavodoxin-dependent (E)-4-hydroxy-3-methylbut-2-enyl-diphosphate synthase [Acidobacteriota bacterium]
MIERRASRKVRVGSVEVGGGAPVSVQSMCTTRTAEVDATLQQIAALAASGCDIVRVAVPDADDSRALPQIARASTIPVVADIQFQWRYALTALEAGCHGIRINPGNIKKHDKVALIGREAAARGVPIRIGVNAGSLERGILERHGGPTAGALVESALAEVRLLEDIGFRDIKISVKHSDPLTTIHAYRTLAGMCDYPLHLGVTEAGPPGRGILKSAVGIGTLLAEGIGDTIRISLTADPVEEVKAGTAILEALGLRERGFDLIACPSCGRAEVDIIALATAVEERLAGIDVPMRVAVMGCIVNGPGEAREADIGVAAGKGKGQIFVRGEVVRTVPEEAIVDEIAAEAKKLAAERRAGGAAGAPGLTPRPRAGAR